MVQCLRHGTFCIRVLEQTNVRSRYQATVAMPAKPHEKNTRFQRKLSRKDQHDSYHCIRLRAQVEHQNLRTLSPSSTAAVLKTHSNASVLYVSEIESLWILQNSSLTARRGSTVLALSTPISNQQTLVFVRTDILTVEDQQVYCCRIRGSRVSS